MARKSKPAPAPVDATAAREFASAIPEETIRAMLTKAVKGGAKLFPWEGVATQIAADYETASGDDSLPSYDAIVNVVCDVWDAMDAS